MYLSPENQDLSQYSGDRSVMEEKTVDKNAENSENVAIEAKATGKGGL